MEGGDPDAPLQKRPRLDSIPPPTSYTSSTYPPTPHHPAPRPPLVPASSSPTPIHYPPPTLPAPPAQSRPSTSSAPPFDHQRSLADIRSLPAPPQGQRPNYGAPVSLPSRSYSQDHPYTSHPPGTPSHTAPSEPPGRRPSLHEAKPTPMDHGGHPSQIYIPQDPRQNGSMPNGYNVASPQEQYGPPPQMTSNQPYQSTPLTPYGPQTPYMGAPTQYPGQAQMRRKQVRATQACNNCRTRKQKCDEHRPCQFCRENNYDCQYKDVPPPKSDRTMMQILDGIQKMNEKMDAAFNGLASRVDQLERRYKSDPSDTTGPPSQQASPNTAAEQVMLHKQSMDPESHSSNSTPMGFHNFAQPYPPQQSRTNSTVTKTEDHAHTGNRKVEQPSESGIPIDHMTAAHQLANIWPGVKDFFDLRTFKDDDKEDEKYYTTGENFDYPTACEQRRGLLRVYGIGQGNAEDDGVYGLSPASPSSNGETPATPPSIARGRWGISYASSPKDLKRSDSATPSAMSGDGSFKGNPGGFSADGRLKLDTETVKRLHQTYLRHIDILHPLLDKSRLQKMIDRFIAESSPDAPITAFSPGSAVPSHVMEGERYVPMKRKRSNSTFDTYSSPAEGWANGNGSAFKNFPEPSIANAIVLLVLALGKVCEHKDVLPGPVGPGELGSTGEKYKASPGSSSDTVGGSPLNTDREARKSVEPGVDRSQRSLRNIDVMPGLAYYAYATDILGNLHGGNEIPHAQAFLLAGLYMAQYARVLESWSWIFSACRVCSILIKKDFERIKRPIADAPNPNDNLTSKDKYKLNLLKIVYWTCLQLESDILAEMSSLPPSGISKHQDDIDYPKGFAENYESVLPQGQDDTMIFYSVQIHLRILLNNAHRELYSKNKAWASNNHTEYLQWAGATANNMEEMLQLWRERLPPPLVWSDKDPPATDINVARMRAKYYGARYMILRPFLRITLQKMDFPPRVATSGSTHSSPRTPNERDIADFSDIQKDMLEYSKRCIQSLIQSTNAFDRVGVNPDITWRPGWDHIPKRLITTNIFGTLHAQFGNIIVLAAVYKSRLRRFVGLEDRDTLNVLLTRTITVLRRLAPNSPTLKIDAQILENAQKILNGHHEPIMAMPVSLSTSTSFDATYPGNR